MNNLSNILRKFATPGPLASFLTLVLVTAALIVAPQKTNVAKSENCSNAPTVATLNFFPVTWDSVAGYGCTDFAPIAVRNLNNNSYGSSDSAQSGDELYVRIYAHNGAQQGLDPQETTAYGVNGIVNISGGTISTTFSGSRGTGGLTNVVSGSVNVNIPDGARLEMVPGSGQFFDYQANQISGNDNIVTDSASFDMGEMQACFEFSKFYRVKVKVVGAAVIETPSGNITASSPAKLSGQCLFQSTVTWSTQNVTSAVVEATDMAENITNVVGYNLNDTTSDTAWMKPDRTYRFTLYNTSNGKTKLASADVTTTGCDQPPVQTPSGDINATNPAKLSGQCLFQSTVSWTTQNVNSARVDATDLKENVTNVVGYNLNDTTSDTAWMKPDRTYRFTLYDTASGQTKLDSVDVNTGSCEIQNPSGQISATPAAKISGMCFFKTTVTWSTQNVTSAVVESTDMLENVTNVVGYNLNDTTSDTSWLQPNRTYRFTLYNTSNGKTKLASADVTTAGCDQPPVLTPSGQISATPAVKISGMCFFRSTVTWSTQNVTSAVVEVTDMLENVTNVVGYNLNDTTSDTAWMQSDRTYRFTLYNTSNGKTKLASADVTTGNCGVPPVCVANTNYFLNADAPVKQGSNYSVKLTWGSGGNHQIKLTQVNSNGSESTLTTGANNGSFTTSANLLAGNTYTFKIYDTNAECGKFLTSTQVIIQSSPTQLVCSADSSSYNIGQPATFRATGGTSPYTWTGNGQSFTGSVFTTTYTTSGNKNVIVFSNDGQTANCSTSINQPVVEKAIVNLTKEVRNGEGAFAHAASAKQNDIVEYRIKVWAGSAVALTNVVVTDTFASGLSYVEGSLKVDGQTHTSGLTSGGLNFSTISQTPKVITYKAKVTATMGSIVNTAQASAQNADNTANDQAVVNVSFVNPGQPSLSITKQVKNVTQNTDYDTAVLAKKNDIVKYQVVIKNVGQAAAKNVFFNDSNPAQVQPLSNLSVSGSFTGGIPQGVSLGDLAAGATVTITYQGTVKADSGTILNIATVSADNATSQNASATVSVSTEPINNGGNNNYCVNYSCNTTTNTTNTTNTTTNTNNNFNYVYINNAGNTVPANQYSQLGVSKSVRQANSGAFQNSVTVNNNDTVEFEIVVTNTGNQNINNVRLTDNLTNGLSIVSGTVRVDGSYVSDSNLYSGMYLGSLPAGAQKRVSFQARVSNTGNSSIQNIAIASGDNAASVQDDAWVFVNTGSVQGGNVSLTYSKKAFNETKNQDATVVTASKENYIVYTLTATNNGNTPANNFVITDDLSQVLPYADISDNGGGTVTGNVISFPGLTVPAYGAVSRSFKVRVKYSLADNLSYVMTNTYGNSISVRINTPQVLGAFVAPKTGAETGAFAFAGLLTAATALVRSRKQLLKLIFT